MQRVRYKAHKPMKGKPGFDVRNRTLTTTNKYVDDFPVEDREAVSELIELGYNIQITLF